MKMVVAETANNDISPLPLNGARQPVASSSQHAVSMATRRAPSARVVVNGGDDDDDSGGGKHSPERLKQASTMQHHSTAHLLHHSTGTTSISVTTFRPRSAVDHRAEMDRDRFHTTTPALRHNRIYRQSRTLLLAAITTGSDVIASTTSAAITSSISTTSVELGELSRQEQLQVQLLQQQQWNMITSYVGVIVVLSLLVVCGLLFTLCRLLIKAAAHGDDFVQQDTAPSVDINTSSEAASAAVAAIIGRTSSVCSSRRSGGLLSQASASRQGSSNVSRRVSCCSTAAAPSLLLHRSLMLNGDSDGTATPASRGNSPSSMPDFCRTLSARPRPSVVSCGSTMLLLPPPPLSFGGDRRISVTSLSTKPKADDVIADGGRHSRSISLRLPKDDGSGRSKRTAELVSKHYIAAADSYSSCNDRRGQQLSLLQSQCDVNIVRETKK